MIHNYDDFCWRCLTFGQRKPPRPSDARVTGENTGLTTNSASPPPFYRSLSLSTQKAQRKRQTCILPLFNMEEITVEVVSSFTFRRSFDDLGKWSKLVVPSPTSSFFYFHTKPTQRGKIAAFQAKAMRCKGNTIKCSFHYVTASWQQSWRGWPNVDSAYTALTPVS